MEARARLGGPLAEAEAALDGPESGEHFGKLVLEISSA